MPIPRNSRAPLPDKLGVITHLLQRLVDFIIPPDCAACSEPVRPPRVFCADCADSVTHLPEVLTTSEQGYRIVSPFAYGGPVANAIHRLKYSNRPELARVLAMPLAERLLLASPPPNCLLIPVPSTPERIVERGYNQSALLALALARKCGLLCLPMALERRHLAPHQVGANRAHRIEQVAGAFVARKKATAGANVIIVDDVITTGATSAACAAALESVGARVFAVAAVARVV